MTAGPGVAPIPLLAIIGPTGVGKTALAVALAASLPMEVIGVDSRQVYRRMDIGTGKPTAAERRAVRHHLVDVAEPEERYDAARFVREASVAILDVRARGRLPVLVGGTGLYYRALLRGLAPRPPGDPGLRGCLQALVAAEGPAALHRRLAAVDRVAAGRLHANDVVRVTRALEVATLTGGPVDAGNAAGWRQAPSPYRVLALGLTMPREALYRRLDVRVDRMLGAGLLDEVRTLLEAGVGTHLPAMQGIGYRHLVPVVQGRQPLGGAVAAMKRDTRRYAKRQGTWFAREEVQWSEVPGGESAALVDAVKKLVDRARLFA